MKHLIIIATTLLSFVSNALQVNSEIIDIEEGIDYSNIVQNSYYKDINNFLDQFEGTWVYNNAGVYFKIVLEKIVKKNSGYFFYDTLEGEYQYTVNGNDLVNTFSNPALISAIRTPILLKSNWKPLCPDCSPQNRRVDLILAERSRNLSGGIILRRITVNGKPALQGSVSKGGVATYDPENPPAYFTTSIPEQDFLFIKQ